MFALPSFILRSPVRPGAPPSHHLTARLPNIRSHARGWPGGPLSCDSTPLTAKMPSSQIRIGIQVQEGDYNSKTSPRCNIFFGLCVHRFQDLFTLCSFPFFFFVRLVILSRQPCNLWSVLTPSPIFNKSRVLYNEHRTHPEIYIVHPFARKPLSPCVGPSSCLSLQLSSLVSHTPHIISSPP